MKVSQSSWHFKAWKWMQISDKPLRVPSVCSYLATVLVGAPFLSIVIAMVSPLIVLLWLANKTGIEKRLKGKSFCPFGKVEFEAVSKEGFDA